MTCVYMWFIQLLKIKLILETKKELMGLIFDLSMEAMIMGALGGLRRVWGPHIHLHAVDHWGIPGEVPSHWTTNFLFSVAHIKTCRDILPHQIASHYNKLKVAKGESNHLSFSIETCTITSIFGCRENET